MVYSIQIVRAAQKQILSLPREAQADLASTIDRLADVSRPHGCRKLRGTELWRIRLKRYRVVYGIDDKAKLVTILKVALRKEDTYR